ncbi:MAG: TIGR01212 family radical SAM protein, partial [Rikenellaceae bacterium]|nr:TIGR01212 family radical SAM protein [Rikenellaceae bacterium]
MIYPWGDARRFNSYSRYFKQLFGTRVQKVTVNAGFTCPNRDGTIGVGGCTFCNNEAFSPSYCTSDKSVRQQIEEGIEFHTNRYRRAEKYLAYFQAFSNTHAPLSELQRIYDQAFAVPAVIGVVIGTRPDCVDDEKLDYFARLAEERYVAIEYGIESCYDQTLRQINRGHDFACAQRA